MACFWKHYRFKSSPIKKKQTTCLSITRILNILKTDAKTLWQTFLKNFNLLSIQQLVEMNFNPGLHELNNKKKGRRPIKTIKRQPFVIDFICIK